MQHFIVFIQKLQLIINFMQVALLTLSMMSKLKKILKWLIPVYSQNCSPPLKKQQNFKNYIKKICSIY